MRLETTAIRLHLQNPLWCAQALGRSFGRICSNGAQPELLRRGTSLKKGDDAERRSLCSQNTPWQRRCAQKRGGCAEKLKTPVSPASGGVGFRRLGLLCPDPCGGDTGRMGGPGCSELGAPGARPEGASITICSQKTPTPRISSCRIRNGIQTTWSSVSFFGAVATASPRHLTVRFCALNPARAGRKPQCQRRATRWRAAPTVRAGPRAGAGASGRWSCVFVSPLAQRPATSLHPGRLAHTGARGAPHGTAALPPSEVPEAGLCPRACLSSPQLGRGSPSLPS